MRAAVVAGNGSTHVGLDRAEVQADGGQIVSDENALRGVLTELIDNAFKYSWAGCTTRVHARSSGDGGTIIDVEDDGMELPADVDVFAPFTRGATPGPVSGSG